MELTGQEVIINMQQEDTILFNNVYQIITGNKKARTQGTIVVSMFSALRAVA